MWRHRYALTLEQHHQGSGGTASFADRDRPLVRRRVHHERLVSASVGLQSRITRDTNGRRAGR